jgi:hypothetical protein
MLGPITCADDLAAEATKITQCSSLLPSPGVLSFQSRQTPAAEVSITQS